MTQEHQLSIDDLMVGDDLPPPTPEEQAALDRAMAQFNGEDPELEQAIDKVMAGRTGGESFTETVDRVVTPAPTNQQQQQQPLQPKKPKSLMDYALTPDYITGRKEELGEMVYFMNGLAVRTQITILFAAPNVGKTLLTLSMVIKDVQAGNLGRDEVIYVNADDGGHLAIDKAQILQKYGIVPLVVGEQGLTRNAVIEAINSMCHTGEALNKVLILDTLTKFADGMSKNENRILFELFRRFTAAGGSVVILGHTNKNRNEQGKRVFAGVSDPIDNADNGYILDTAGEDETTFTDNRGISRPGAKRYTVLFERLKTRGDNPDELSFQFIKWNQADYSELLENVKLSDADQARAEMARKDKRDRLKAKRAGYIDDAILIYEVLVDSSELNKGDFVKLAMSETGIGRDRIRTIMREFHNDYWTDKKLESRNTRVFVPMNHPREWNQEDEQLTFIDDRI